MKYPTPTSFLDDPEESPVPRFTRFEDYASWASYEIAMALTKRAKEADAKVPLAGAHCDWDEDEDGTHHTRCNNAFVFIDGSFAENGFNFCPFCGGPITCHIHETGTDE